MDMSSVEDALSSISTTSSSTTASETENLPPTRVLLWNIHGETRRPGTNVRNLLVPRVVQVVNPDILLLQETKTDKLINNIIWSTNRGYQQVQAGDRTESRILYANKYTEISKDEKLFPRHSEQKTLTLNEVLQQSIRRVIPRDGRRVLRHGVVQGATRVYDSRLSIVGLRVRDHPEIPIMIFLSFHNVYKKANRAGREQIAGEFCRLVSIIQELTGCVVVGGADLNCQLSRQDVERFNVINYMPTVRRSGKKIDYFVVAPPDVVEPESVKALNFNNTVQGNDLHPLMSGLLRPGSGIPYTTNNYRKALDHDP